MNSKKCMLKDRYKCPIWQDYKICQYELEDAAELSHGNWIEIQYLQDRVNLLEQLIKQSGIDIPTEF